MDKYKYRKLRQKWEKIISELKDEGIDWDLDLIKMAEAYEEKVRLENEDKLMLH